MAIQNSVRYILPGLGTAGLRGAAGTSSTITANVVNATCNLPTGMIANLGYIHVKVSGVDAGHAVMTLVVEGSDGSTSEYLYGATFTGAGNGEGADSTFPFIADRNFSSFTAHVGLSTGATTAVVDIEAWGQDNAGLP